MSFCADAWDRTAGTRAEIYRLPFVAALGDGTLPLDRFVGYMVQDAHYLREYARVLATAAAKADVVADLAFFARGAVTAVEVEAALHASRSAGAPDPGPSPTCTAYTSFLLATAQTDSYAELVAAVLPCYWLYSDVGTVLSERAARLTDHPYGDWIGTYADPAFEAATATVRAVADRLAAESGPATVDRMHARFALACEYERRFWEAAWVVESWDHRSGGVLSVP
ncbi:MAG: TenA family transcriptional regulator [Cryptosporangiaceae bacterium]|jgi:thiaminase/transcriptional activator TenA|nr:TenA family transcriptional regulator [Cryptosporangiaceae bacterium]